MTADEFKAIRVKIGVSQGEMGRRIGVKAQSILRYETYRQPIPTPQATIMRIIEAMKSPGTNEQKLKRISAILTLDKE